MDNTTGRPVTMWMRHDQIEALDRIAAKARISRSKLLSNMIDVGIDEIKLYDATGIAFLAGLVRDLQAGYRNRLRKPSDDSEVPV